MKNIFLALSLVGLFAETFGACPCASRGGARRKVARRAPANCQSCTTCPDEGCPVTEAAAPAPEEAPRKRVRARKRQPVGRRSRSCATCPEDRECATCAEPVEAAQ